MKSWLKFFWLSFFSDKIAKEAKARGVMNCVLGLVLALAFIFCGVLASNTIPFYSHYNKAAGFKSFVNGFIAESGLSVSGNTVSSEKRVNTFENTADAEKYGVNGYNLVIDTRPSTALDDFEAYCLAKDGNAEISYEAYLELDDEQKSGYDFKIRYTANELTLTNELIEGYGSYLENCGNEDAAKQYSEIKADRKNLTAKEYRDKVYALYIRTYYPSISAFERWGEVPLLRSYYYNNYLNGSVKEKSLFVFDNLLFGYFETDGGMNVNFYGAYEKVVDGQVPEGGADGFIKGAFRSMLASSATVYLMNVVRFIPIIALIPAIFALFVMLAYKGLKDDKYKKYTTCLKIQFSYLAIAGLLCALVLFVCGFFLSGTMLNILPIIIFSAIMAVRTAVLIVWEHLNAKKAKQQTNSETENI